jgi:hypothetical protein
MKHIFAAILRLFLIGGILSGFSSGCKIIDPAEEIPSYLHIDSITLSVANSAVQGTATSDITDAWVYMDGNLLGGFPLPCNIPILAEGSHHFIIKGGVKMNGVASTRAIYPSWKGWEGDLTLTRAQKVTVEPIVTYFPLTDFSNFMENFETIATGITPELTNGATGILKKDSTYNVYEGNCSGYVHLNNSDTIFFLGTSNVGYPMPASKETWIEFNYWCDAQFTCGIEDVSNPAYHVAWSQILPSRGWKKIYIRLTDALAEAEQEIGPGHSFKIYFAMQTPAGQSEAHLYLDNIKLLK